MDVRLIDSDKELFSLIGESMISTMGSLDFGWAGVKVGVWSFKKILRGDNFSYIFWIVFDG